MVRVPSNPLLQRQPCGLFQLRGLLIPTYRDLAYNPLSLGRDSEGRRYVARQLAGLLPIHVPTLTWDGTARDERT